MTRIQPSSHVRHLNNPAAAVGVAQLAAAPAQVLPLRARAGVSASVSGPGWLFVVGGAVVGGLFLGLPGALLGALGGYLLVH